MITITISEEKRAAINAIIKEQIAKMEGKADYFAKELDICKEKDREFNEKMQAQAEGQVRILIHLLL